MLVHILQVTLLMLVIGRVEGFRSVVVITLASHARGPGFEPQRNQLLLESSKQKIQKKESNRLEYSSTI